MTEFDYEAFWQEEAKAKAAQKEAEWHCKNKEARMQEFLGENWKELLADSEWVAAENARRAKKNEDYRKKYLY